MDKNHKLAEARGAMIGIVIMAVCWLVVIAALALAGVIKL